MRTQTITITLSNNDFNINVGSFIDTGVITSMSITEKSGTITYDTAKCTKAVAINTLLTSMELFITVNTTLNALNMAKEHFSNTNI